MIEYIDIYTDETTNYPRVEPRQVRKKIPVLSCDCCGISTRDNPDLRLAYYADAELCEECFKDIAWFDAEAVEL